MTCTSADFFYRPLNTQLQRLAPAIPEIVSSAGGLLAHVFSNGGAHSLITVATAYRTATGVALPIRGLVLDSAPAGGDNDTTVRTFSVLLQETPWWVKAPGMAGTYAFFYGFVALAEALGPSSFKYQNPVERVRAGLNDVKLLGGGGKRTYIFGKGDAMVDPVDVERHAEEAKKMGMWTVKTERFDESAHVAHVREGKERYWAVVQQCWHEDGPKL